MDRLRDFKEECQEIADYCESQGLPSHGSTYELMVEELREFYFGKEA